MALTNYSYAAPGPVSGVFTDTSPAPLRADLDDLLYSPEDHQQENQPLISDHEPFSPPNHQRRPKLRKRAGSAYLPPPNQYTHYPRPDEVPQNPYSGIQTHVYQQNTRLDVQIENQRVHEINPQYDNNGQYVHDPSGDYDYEQRRLEQSRQAYRPGFGDPPYPPATLPPPPQQTSRRYQGGFQNSYSYNVPQPHIPPPTAPPLPQRPPSPLPPANAGGSHPGPSHNTPSYTKVEQGGSGGKTQLHAILDYDEDNYDEIPAPDPAITPVQGPILIRNGTVPVVPLTSYPTTNNGSLYQIPLLWTALSVALGYELQGQVIKGLPCVKRNFQLYCPTAGNTYPKEKIDLFIDENKALIKRMYGSFTTPGGNRVRRAPGVQDMHTGDSYFRHVRQASASSLPDLQSINGTGKLDVCESRTEITTPYWALNSAKKIRAIVNTMHFEQAIHQEVCSKSSTARCTKDCGCEQKYKWHRLLAYDPTDDCAGIFMDWFLFPSCCVCRCKP